MNGVSGAWGTSIHVSASPQVLKERVQRLLSPRTLPSSAGYRPQSGLAFLRNLDGSTFVLGYAWHQQQFTWQGSFASSDTQNTEVCLTVKPTSGNAMVMAIVAVCVAFLVTASIVVRELAVLFVPFAALWVTYSFWLVRESARHATRAATRFLERLSGTTE